MRPIACTLNQADLASQRDRWHRLAAEALIERAETGSGLRISFRPGADEELRALVAVENECCAWAEWSVETGPEQVVLVVRSTGDGVATLHAMFTSLEASSR